MPTDYQAVDIMRREAIARLWPLLPRALGTLSRCAIEPCDQGEFATARDVVLRWLQFSKACESQAVANRAKMRRRHA